MELSVIQKQKNFNDSSIDGIFGLGPTTINWKKTLHENYVRMAAKRDSEEIGGEPLIEHAVYAVLVSPDTRVREHEIMIGDYDTDLVQGGEDGIDWYNNCHEQNWYLKLTDTYMGENHLCQQCHRKAMINVGFEGIGVPFWELNKIKKVFKQAHEKWWCDDGYCMNEETCDDVLMDSLVPDYTFTLQDRMNYTIPVRDLLQDIPDTLHHKVTYKCRLMVYWYNNGYFDDAWLIGDTFLKSHYSIYDIDRKLVGLGKLEDDIRPRREPEYTEDPDQDVNQDPPTHEPEVVDPTPVTHDSKANGGLITIVVLLSFVIVFLIGFLVYSLKQKKATRQNGSLQVVADSPREDEEESQ